MARELSAGELASRLEEAMRLRVVLRETTLEWKAARESIFEELRRRELVQPERSRPSRR
jgi:hypothetical protein